jgi:predicted dehydrogenase
MSNEIRYGVIGTGMMGVEHIYNIRHLDGARLTAVSDPDPISRETGRKAADVSEDAAFASHHDLLASGLCDAVVVASPNHTHAGILMDVLATDVHVMAEKPLTTTVEDCARVIAASESSVASESRRGTEGNRRVVWMALEYRYMAPIARLLEEVRAGTAGAVHMVAIREHRFPFLPKVGHWNRFTASTGGTLVEKCCHFFDLMNLITGASPVRVMASGGQSVNHLDEVYDEGVPDMLDNAYVIVEYDSGARAVLDLCMFAEGGRNEQELAVVGDVAKIEAFVPEAVLRIGRRADRSVHDEHVPMEGVRYEGLHHGSSYLEHVDFLEAIRTGAPPKVTLHDGMIAVAIGVAAHRSIAEHRMVEMAEVLPS